MEEETGEVEKVKENFRIIKGKFKYGKYNDEVGMFMAIISSEDLKSWNLIMTDNPESRLTPVDGDYIVFRRVFNDNSIKDKKRSYRFKQQLKEKIKMKLEKLFTDNKAEVEEFFNQELHLLAKEKVKLEFALEETTKEELKDKLPQLFVTEVNTEKEIEEDQEDTVLDCSLLISPLKGKRVVEFNSGDQILVETSTPNYNLIAEELSEIAVDENRLIAEIEEIKYDHQEKVYHFLVQFSEDFFGEATIDANSNMKLKVPDQNSDDKNQEPDDVSDHTMNVFLVSLILIILLLMLITLL